MKSYFLSHKHFVIKVALSQKRLKDFYNAQMNIPNDYPEQKIWFPALNSKQLNQISAQDSDLEYLCWRYKDSPVSSHLKPTLIRSKREWA